MQTSDFSNSKLFVLIKSSAETTLFTNNPLGENVYRAAADASGVLVFLEPIHRIYTHGTYYSIGSDDWSTYVNKVAALENSVTSMLGTMANMESAIQSNSTAIGNLPYTDETTGEQIAGSGLLNQLANLAQDVSDLQHDVSVLSPGGESLSEIVEETVNTKIRTAMSNYVALSDYNTDMAAKLNASDFNTFSTSVTGRLDTLEGQQATNTSAISVLQQAVSAVPKFGIVIVDNLPSLHILDKDGQPTNEWNIESASNPTGISLSKIYLLKRSQSAEQGSNELFTEYICVKETVSNVDTYRWEKLGSQFFTIENYYTNTEVNDAIKDAINKAVGVALTDPDIASDSNWYTTLKDQMSSLSSSVSDNADAISELQSLLTSVDANQQRILAITGEDIKTHTNGNTTVAQDIDALQGQLTWTIIDSSEEQQEP